MRRSLRVLPAALLLAGLAGCTAAPPATGGGSATVTSTVAASATPTVTETATVSASATPVASGSSTSGAPTASDPGRPAGQCGDSVLTVALSMPKGAAGSFYQDIVFTNTGGASCVLRGTPGLSVVGDGDGTQLGAAASRDQSGAKDVRLAAHGGQVYARFGGPELGPGSEGARHCSGGTAHGDGYRVYPPHSRRAFFVRDGSATACPTGGAFLSVDIVKAEQSD